MTLADPAVRPPAAPPTSPSGSVRLLVGVGAGPITLGRHRSIYPPPARSAKPRPDLIDLVARSGLRGRGGAAFPTATKLEAVVASRHRPVVVVDGAEGEPLSRKDALLLARAPHLVLDGAVLAAAMVGADEVHIAADRADHEVLLAVDRAILARRSEGEPLAAACSLRPTPSHYVAGEETALVRHLNGGPALPTALAIRPYRKGVDGRPTLVLNVETAAHLAQIARWGPDWFREQGTVEHPGTTLATISGGVVRPGVHEVPLGLPLADLAALAGGSTVAPRAVLVGGYFGSWVPAGVAAGVGFANESLRPYGAAVGCGSVALLPADACGLCESSRVMTWLAGQTAGQCGPCVHGLDAMARALTDLSRGRGDNATVARLHHWAAQVEGRGACRFPDGAIRFLRSTLEVFADDVRRHEAGQVCPVPEQAILPTPAIPVEQVR